MDFIERWFGVSPDGGDGSLEVVFVLAVVSVVLIFFFRRRLRGLLTRWTTRSDESVGPRGG
jgi:hypothetical protein